MVVSTVYCDDIEPGSAMDHEGILGYPGREG
jgi:hypothetical protein